MSEDRAGFLQIEPAEYRLVVPRTARVYSLGLSPPLDEVWVVLHGFSQLAVKFVRWFAPAVRRGRAIVAPEALNRYYPNHETKQVGTTWMTAEDREAEIRDYVEYLDRVAEDLRARFGDAAIHVHAFSQGCATASRWAAFGRTRPAQVVLWGGGVPPDLDLEAHRERLSSVRLRLVIGDRDQFITDAQVEAQGVRLQAARVEHRLTRFKGGHVIPWNVLREFAEDGREETGGDGFLPLP
jgi:predicted esterase